MEFATSASDRYGIASRLAKDCFSRVVPTLFFIVTDDHQFAFAGWRLHGRAACQY
jgi:hypothetical protein